MLPGLCRPSQLGGGCPSLLRHIHRLLWPLFLPQEVPVSSGQVENYVLLLVLLSVFAGGTLLLLSLLLLFCHRCCLGGRRYSR